MPTIAIRLRAQCANNDMDAEVRRSKSKTMKEAVVETPCTDSTVGFVCETAKDRSPGATAANADQGHF
jgi:hypothetical protein